jgi:hypothetical protein
MGTVYTLPLKLPEADATTIFKNITVGDRNIQFRFQWAVASEEQYNIVLQYLSLKTKSDPLYVDGAYTYNYDFIEYYYPLSLMTDAELEEWIGEEHPLPASIVSAQLAAQMTVLKMRAKEAASLKPVVEQYKEVLKWQFHSLYNGETNVGVVEPGGWYRSQDVDLQFRFVSPLAYIGRKDFERVTIEFEVDNA